MQCYKTRNLNLHGLIINKYFFDNFLILKFLFSELEQFYSSSSSEKLFFRVQVRVRQNNRVFSSSSLSSQPCDLGYSDIAKLIIAYASKTKIDSLKEWDQTTTCSPKYKKYNCNFFKEVMHDDYRQDHQTSFIRLAVRTEQIDLVKLLIKLCKKKNNFCLDSLIRLSLTSKLLMLSQFSQTFILGYVGFVGVHNLEIVEVMLASVSRPKLCAFYLKLILSTTDILKVNVVYCN